MRRIPLILGAFCVVLFSSACTANRYASTKDSHYFRGPYKSVVLNIRKPFATRTFIEKKALSHVDKKTKTEWMAFSEDYLRLKNMNRRGRDNHFRHKGFDAVLTVKRAGGKRLYRKYEVIEQDDVYKDYNQTGETTERPADANRFKVDYRSVYQFELKDLRNGRVVWLASAEISESPENANNDYNLVSLTRSMIKQMIEEEIILPKR